MVITTATTSGLTVLIILQFSLTGSLGEYFEPRFIGSVQNVTVKEGRDAVLSCSVTSSRGYKVGWMKAGDQTILSLHKKVITHNDRISLTHDEHNTWNLHIKDVQTSDQDCYTCQINTEVMKKQDGCVTVLVPPDIDESLSDVTVTEGGNASLTCLAHGQPQPTITWRREDRENIIVRSREGFRKEVAVWKGKNLNLINVRREQMGAFMCIANNNVPPAVSRRLVLTVIFAPQVSVDSQLVGAPLGDHVEVECLIEASPRSITYWQKTGQQTPLLNGSGHLVEEDRMGYKTVYRLKIPRFSSQDAGTYRCVSENSLGRDEVTIRIYENPQVTGPPVREKLDVTDFEGEKSPTYQPTYGRITQRPELRNTYKYAQFTDTDKMGHQSALEKPQAYLVVLNIIILSLSSMLTNQWNVFSD